MTENADVCPSCGWPGPDPGMGCSSRGWHRAWAVRHAVPLTKSFEVDCTLDGCGASVGSFSELELQNWVVWHTFEQHREYWNKVPGVGPLPRNDRPDLSKIFVR